METVAIIGAGVAGLTAAWSLAKHGGRPVVFEKSRGLSGRAASRSREGMRFDHGANFFRLNIPEVDQIVRGELPIDDLVEIPGDVWVFDGRGAITMGDPKQNEVPKFTYRNGISQLGKLLVAASGVEVRRQTRIARMEEASGRWTLWDDQGAEQGSYDRVILAAPAPQCLELIEATTMDGLLKATLVEELAKSRYHRQFSFILGYDEALSRSRPFHALVSNDPQHPVAWLSFEEDKPGHLPEGQGALVVQMSPEWTVQRVDVDRGKLVHEAIREAGLLLDGDFRPPDWWDSQRWMLASPASGVDGEQLKVGEAHGLFFAGDALAGKGRVPLAMASGLAASKAVVAGRDLSWR